MQCFIAFVLLGLAVQSSSEISLAFLAGIPVALLWTRLVIWALVVPGHWIEIDQSGFTLNDFIGKAKSVEWKDVSGVKASNSRVHSVVLTWPFAAASQTAEVSLSKPISVPGYWFLVPYRSLRLSTDDAPSIAKSIEQHLALVGATTIVDP
jgi:hypothetical protein